MVEALAEIPRPSRLLGLALQVPSRHVETDGIAEDAIERRRLINLLALASDHNRKLGLVIYLRANRGQHDGRVVCAERVGQFREDERRCRRRFPAFDGVVNVIAPDGENLSRHDGRQKLDRIERERELLVF